MITIKCPSHYDIAERIKDAIMEFKYGKSNFLSYEKDGCHIKMMYKNTPQMVLMSQEAYNKLEHCVFDNSKYAFLLETIDGKEYFDKVPLIIGIGLNPIDIHII
jgi:hypothetical protein